MNGRHFYLFEGRKYRNMKEIMEYLKISREGFRILRIVKAIERIDNREKLKGEGQDGEGDRTKI